MTIPAIRSMIKSHWLEILGLALLFVALRWNNFNAPFIRDEGEYAYAAQLLIHGVMPYDHAFIQKPPMVIYSYGLANLLLPDEFWSPRLLAYLSVALATLLLGYVARLEFGKGFALPAMALATPMILLPGIEIFPANTEMFLLLPLLATFATYVHARQHGQNLKFWLAAGFSGATTLCFKYTALPLIAFVFVVWLLESWRQTRDWRVVGRYFLVAVFGGVLAVILELGIFLIHDGGYHLWECTVLFNRQYLHSATFNLDHLRTSIENYWHNWPVLFFIPWAIFLRPAPRTWFWLGAFACAVVATSASSYGQYYVPLMLFWALLSAVGIGRLAACLARWPALSGRWVRGLLTLLVLILILRPDAPWMALSPEHFAERKMAGYPFIGSLTVARRVDELSGPDDFVYVAGSEPQTLVYAHRFSPTRFITSYPLMIPSAVAGKYQREAMNDLLVRPPKLIVFPLPGNSWLRQTQTPPEFLNFLQQYLNQNYQIIGGYLPGPHDGHWSEPLTKSDLANASLVLYERKQPPDGNSTNAALR
jgi:4-amino-4-deoxy-L-arabinose transferase-like glycosyltransferase